MTNELLMDAVGMIDDDLITDVAPRRTFRLTPLAEIAAAILLLFGIGVLYAIFVMPSSAVYLDSRESVTLTLNSRGRVLSASGYDGLDGQTAQDAVAVVTRDMLESGAIDANENTLILGTERLSEQERATLTQTVQNVFTESRFHGAIISLPCTDRGAKAAVIDLLLELDHSLKQNNLKKLSVNELNLLLHEYASDEAQLIGEPSATENRKQTVATIKKAAAKPEPEQPQLINGTEAAAGTPPMVNTPYSAPTLGGSYVSPQSTDADSQPKTEVVSPTIAPPAATATELSAKKQTAYAPPIIVHPFAPKASLPTEQSTTPTTTAPTESSTDSLTKPFGRESLLAEIPQSEIITESKSVGSQVPYELLTKAGYRDEMLQIDNQIAVINTSLDLMRFQGYVESNENTELFNFLSGIETAVAPDSIFFRDHALIVAACYYTDDGNYRIPQLESIQRCGNMMYLIVRCDRWTTDAPNDTLLLHKYFVSAKVSKNDLQNIDTLKLVITRTE